MSCTSVDVDSWLGGLLHLGGEMKAARYHFPSQAAKMQLQSITVKRSCLATHLLSIESRNGSISEEQWKMRDGRSL